MKKSELIKLIRETVYAEIPEIISEIKKDLRSELLAEVSNQPAMIKPTQTNATTQKVIGSSGLNVARGGIMEFYKKEVAAGNTNGRPEHGKSPDQISDYMAELFGKKIQ